MNPPKIYATTTLNEKSQAVIPVEARKALGIGPGSKLMVLGSSDGRALILITTEQAERMLLEMTRNMTEALESAKDGHS